MKQLLQSIETLKKSKVKKLVDFRIKEFENKKTDKKIFNELCFCLLTANFNAERSIKIQENIKDGFSNFTKQKLLKKLKELGHRFPNARAKYILEARKHKNSLKNNLKKLQESEIREWLIKNVNGLGMKEASHFLRNIGFKNSAIIDFHIIDILAKHKLIQRPKTLTKKKYLEIENSLKKLAEKSKLTLAELDLYLWCLETGKILK
ncbi:MAG: hypothetical protein ACD_63C00014G0007 [uncultured bacterium]|nr:MAG: hypothetical protein ACD_63C00014G0007 [uncultured bacterium]